MSIRKTAIVTGGSRGIGRAVATALGNAGFNVVVNYNSNAVAADQVAEMVRVAGADARTVQADIGNVADHERLVDTALEAFGGVDVLINNAGVAPKVRADILEMPPESYDFVMNTNLRGPYLLTQRVARWMVANRSDAQLLRSIINISSISAYTASVNRGEYCLAKAGIAMMTKLFAARLAEEDVRVYEIRPGVIATDMTGPVKARYDKLILEEDRGLTPIRRWGLPEDIAKAVVAIVGGAFPFSTGEVFNVDGGFHLQTL